MRTVDVPGEPLACDGVVKVHRGPSGEVHALRGIDARFPAGSVTAVMGPSGSGKSSLLRLLGALDLPTVGEVWIAGERISTARMRARRQLRRRNVGTVLQRPSDNLFEHLDVLDHLEHARHRLRGAQVAGRARARSVDGLLETIGLRDRARNRPAQLSGGEQQRLAVAMAVVHRPPIVLADEPTAELDPVNAEIVIELLRTTATDGTAVVITTHDRRLLERVDRVLELRDGAMASETTGTGRRRVTIDSTGRISLPPEILAWFPERRVELEIDDARVVMRRPPEQSS